MPQRINYRPPELLPGLVAAQHKLEQEVAKFQLYTAAIKRERRDLRAMADAHWDMINASEIRLDDLFDTLKRRHPEGVELSLAMRYLWSSFEGDVRFLCDHVMEDHPVDKESMAHAAASALIGLRSIVMACIRSEDQPFDVNLMLKVIADSADDFKGQKLNKKTPPPTQAWGDAVSQNG
jgi:hypothetical protein